MAKEWVAAIEASGLLEATGQHLNYARQALIRHAQAGTVATRCRRMILTDISGGPPDHDAREVFDDQLIPTKFWSEVDVHDHRNGGDWHMGDFFATEDDVCHVQALGVQFLLADLLKLPRVTADTPPAQATPAVSNRGRKPWPHWEDVWAEMVARAMRGEFSALSQADVERIMLEVAERHPDAPNESTIRLRVQKVWKHPK